MLLDSVTYRRLELPTFQGSYLITTTINYKGLHYSIRLFLSCSGFGTLAMLYPYCKNALLEMCTPMLRSNCFLESEYWGCSSEASFVHSGDLRVLFYQCAAHWAPMAPLAIETTISEKPLYVLQRVVTVDKLTTIYYYVFALKIRS